MSIDVVRWFAYCLPQTMANQTLRSVMARGLDLSSPQVYVGFLSTLSWFVAFNVGSVVILAYKNGTAKCARRRLNKFVGINRSIRHRIASFRYSISSAFETKQATRYSYV